MPNFEVPQIIVNQYKQLCDLVQNQSDDGLLNFRQVANYIKKDPQWLLRTTYNGMCPFAFGSDKGVNRGSVCFHTLPFYSFMTQGMIYRSVADYDILTDIVKP